MKLKKEKVYLIMAEKQLSMSDIAKRCGKTRQRISCIFNSVNILPKTAGMIAESLNCDVIEIIEEE